MSESPRNGATAWAAASICSTVVLALGGAFGSSYVRDQARSEDRIRILEAERQAAAFVRGATEQQIEELTSSLHKLDETLQREMRLLDSSTEAKVVEMDRRLQGEIQALIREHADRLDNIRAWIDRYDAVRWTREDHERFKAELGLGLSVRDRGQ